ncbi:MAG: hypothetical protein WDO19_24375 [Bacteroidota bacterium]
MKAIYISLFFVDAIILVALSFLFLKLIDNKASGAALTEMAAGISICVILLVYVLYKYMKIPNDDSHK